MAKICNVISCSFVLLVLFYSCVSDMEIDDVSNSENIVVNCLFSPDKQWELSVAKAKNMLENEDPFVENAVVEIRSDLNEPIVLEHLGKGKYGSSLWPEIGTTYNLSVCIPGFEEMTAQSRIPDSVQANVENLEVDWIRYVYPNNLLSYEVFPVTVKFNEPVINSQFLFRAFLFYASYGYQRYLLPTSELEKMKEQDVAEIIITRLSKLVDSWQKSKDVFNDVTRDVEDREAVKQYYKLINTALIEKSVTERDYQVFHPISCFADNQGWLTNISYDTYTVLGSSERIDDAKLLINDENIKDRMAYSNSTSKRECWLEVTQGDFNYIEYYKTYLLQLSQRVNPYSEPVIVHSNIKNGAGIFAGYNRQMIHLFDF